MSELIGVIGAGAWGTALAQVAAVQGPVRLWAREPEVAEEINRDHRNSLFLRDVVLSPAITATTDLRDLASCSALLVVCPAQHVRSTLQQLPAMRVPLILCAKGIEAGSGKLLSEVAEEIYAGPIAVLSGPTFAREVALGLPTAITLACADDEIRAHLIARLGQSTFRPYGSKDVTGAEIGGAVKNVLAIACGVVLGRKMGENARAALIARGFAEMQRFGLAKGARAETLAGLSGLGDLVLTCSSLQSRNMSLGAGLGEGKSAKELMSNRHTVAEGAHTAPVLLAAAEALGVDMPITRAVVALLQESATVDETIAALLARPMRDEGC